MSSLFAESRLRQWVRKLAAAAGGLFPEDSEVCLGCAKRKCSPEAGKLTLCQACYRQIPWIERVVCQTCGRGADCPDCRRRNGSHYICSRSAVHYDAKMKDWLAAYKYRGRERLGPLLAGMTAHAFHALQSDPVFVRDRFTVFTYVPLSAERLEIRGFNQSRQLAEALSAKFSLPVFDLLHRVKDTGKQSMKARAARFADLRGAFMPNEDEMHRLLGMSEAVAAKSINVIVVDDVYTTGSTLQCCAQAVKEQLNCHVYGLTWAR